MQATRTGPGVATSLIQDDHYTYDAVGNPAQILRTPTDSLAAERECFTYDARQRLTSANAIASAGTCGTVGLGGPAGFDESYSYDSLDKPPDLRTVLEGHRSSRSTFVQCQ